MRTHRLMVSVISAGLMLGAMAFPAHAQLLDDDGVPYSTQYYRQAIGLGDISLRRGEGLLPGQFILHVQDREAPSSGCAKLSKIPTKVEYSGTKIKIDYLDYTVDMRDQPPGLPSRCVKNLTMPYAETILDTAVLKEQGIKKIRLSHHGSPIETTLEITDHMVRLWPPYANKDKKNQQSTPGDLNIGAIKSSGALRIIGGATADGMTLESFGASTIWLYPKNTVILYVPDTDTAAKTKGLRDRLDSLAAAHGMKPLETLIPEFKSPLKGKNAFYYLAKNDRAASTRGKFMDNIQVDTVVYGLEHDQTTTKDVPVFIRAPGQND